MGMFAFRRAKEREAAKKVASIPIEKPTIKPSDGNNNRRNSRGSKRKQLSNTGRSK